MLTSCAGAWKRIVSGAPPLGKAVIARPVRFVKHGLQTSSAIHWLLLISVTPGRIGPKLSTGVNVGGIFSKSITVSCAFAGAASRQSAANTVNHVVLNHPESYVRIK